MHHVKSLGYFISTISVILLASVSWSKAQANPLMLACLAGGAVTSIIGMFCRWLSYEIEQRRKSTGAA